MIQPLPTDTTFKTSPDAGHPACLCSRCGSRIGAEEFPLRLWPADGAWELRYCERCQLGMGLADPMKSTPLPGDPHRGVN